MVFITGKGTQNIGNTQNVTQNQKLGGAGLRGAVFPFADGLVGDLRAVETHFNRQVLLRQSGAFS